MKTTFIMPLLTMILWVGCTRSEQPKLPEFTILLLDSTTLYNTKHIPDGKPALIIYFSPECTHCQSETEKILSDMQRFKDISLCYVSMETIQNMKVFYDYYKMQKYPNIIMGKDFQYFVISNYHPQTTPFTVLYNKQKQQCRTFQGEFNFSQLTNAIDSL